MFAFGVLAGHTVLRVRQQPAQTTNQTDAAGAWTYVEVAGTPKSAAGAALEWKFKPKLVLLRPTNFELCTRSLVAGGSAGHALPLLSFWIFPLFGVCRVGSDARKDFGWRM